MAKKHATNLSRRERQIMEVLYAKGQANALEVMAELPDPPGKTAVRTLLRILEEKGHVVHEELGQTYIYRPRQSRESVGPSALRRVLDVFFGGSLEQAVAAHLGESAEDLTPEELKRLAQLIQRARQSKQGKNP